MYSELEKLTYDYLHLGVGLSREQAEECARREYIFHKKFIERWPALKRRLKHIMVLRSAPSTDEALIKNQDRARHAGQARQPKKEIKK